MDTSTIIAWMPPHRRREHCHQGVTHYIRRALGPGVTVNLTRLEGGRYISMVSPPMGRTWIMKPETGRYWKDFRGAWNAAHDFARKTWKDRIIA